MSKRTSYLLGITLTIIFGSIFYYFLCCSVYCNKESCNHKQDAIKSAGVPEIKDVTKNGILEININTSSKGQTEPIADIATEEGKSENRRTLVIIN